MMIFLSDFFQDHDEFRHKIYVNGAYIMLNLNLFQKPKILKTISFIKAYAIKLLAIEAYIKSVKIFISTINNLKYWVIFLVFLWLISM